jgi:uncharacterized membrane protein YagU involved in acid resistance
MLKRTGFPVNARRGTGARLLGGAAAGLGATLVMSLFMGLGKKMLPSWQRYPLPPRLITVDLATRAGLEEAVDEEPEASAATTAGHLGYGALGGAVYAAAAADVGLPALVKGLLFGLVFWTVSYMGWLPAAGVLSPPSEHPRERTLLMVLAHLVYGSATGILTSWLVEKK